MFENGFGIGLGGYTSAYDEIKDDENNYFTMGYVGVYLIKKFPLNEKVNLNTNLHLAFGELSSFDKEGDVKNNVEESSMQIIEPAIGLGYNIMMF